MHKNEFVILVHGYHKSSRDMLVLKKNLEQLHYQVIALDLPLTYQRLTEGINCFEKAMDEICRENKNRVKLHLVGHSTGGLIIRNFIYMHKTINIGRCVCIATPHKGTKIVDLIGRIFPIFVKAFKTLEDLKTNKAYIYDQWRCSNIEVGVIAGNKSNLLLGKLLTEKNDGRVEVESTKFKDMKDFIVTPYGHKEIHYQYQTAQLIDQFLKKGFFS
ncbi:alpha/beta fold hydrolase [Clostridiaceae bacterium 35-E11]